jgi:hypothetical protein
VNLDLYLVKTGALCVVALQVTGCYPLSTENDIIGTRQCNYECTQETSIINSG